jgi:prepilin-type N-terminal cleavage/methylation domain-containing protein
MSAPAARSSRRRARRHRRGFTLVEVLATLVLMAIVLPVAMRGISMALRAASVSKHTSEAAALAQAKLNELVTDQTSTGALNGSGDFGADHPEYTWTCISTQRDYGLTQLDLRVSWKEGGLNERFVDLSTFYIPAGSSTRTGTSMTGGGG